MGKKDRLKNGLDMLFEDNYSESESSSDRDNSDVSVLRISLIEPDPLQPRTKFDEEKLRELSENISQHGILQPILVRPIGNGSYRIVAGERRWRAARMAGLAEAPVIIKELSDLEAAQISLVENLQREDLDPIEEAAALKRLIDQFGMTQEAAARSVGKSRSAIANSLRLLSLPQNVQDMISAGEISVGHAKVLCGIDDPVRMTQLAIDAKNGKSVRDIEKAAKDETTVLMPLKTRKKSPKKLKGVINDEFSKFSITAEEQFKIDYGLDSKIYMDSNGYLLRFDFKTEEELRKFIEKLSDIMDSSYQ